MSQDTSNHSFDDLARGLAEGSISRRRALKLFAGTAIAALIPSTRAMAAIPCPPGTVKICHVPQRADGTCRRGAAQTRCVSPEAAATHAGHPCDCCGGCGGTDNCREPKPRTCFSTTPMCIPPGGACPRGFECCEGGGGCLNHVCIPPGGGNLIECACVDNTGDAVFCSSAACGSSDLEQVCDALCATSGGVKNLQCTACSTNCRCP